MIGKTGRTITSVALYIFAVFVILAAMIVGAAFFITPQLDKHRAELEAYASEILQTPVTIKNVKLSWYRYQPVIDLRSVVLLNKETKQPALKIKKVNILFSIPRSLWHRQFVTSGVVISGSNVTVNQLQTGEFSIPGITLPIEQTPSSDNKLLGALALLSQAPHLILQNIDVHYTQYNEPARFFTINHLNIKNSDENHAMQGHVILHQAIPVDVNVVGQWQGKEVNLEKITAQVYLSVSGFSFSQWLKGYAWKEWQVNRGLANAKVWLAWQEGVLQRAQSEFQAFDVELYSQHDKSTHGINRASGNIGWKREGQDYVFAGDDILIDLPTHLWPVTRFTVSLIPNASGELAPKLINISYVDFHDIQSFLLSSPSLFPDATHQLLTELKLKGVLQNTTLKFSGAWNDWSHLSADTHFSGLSFATWKKIPGATNLTGLLTWNGVQGELQLNSHRSAFQFHSIANHELMVEQLSGKLKFQQDAQQQWLLEIPSLQILNNDAAINLNGTVTLPAQDVSPFVDLKANMSLQKASNVSRYLPADLFDAELNAWLKQAFLAGEVENGHMILHGKLNEFPFDHQNGEFKITSKVKNVDLRFAPNWPLLRHINASLEFMGRKIQIDVDSAETQTIPLKNVHAVIPYLGDAQPPILEIQADNVSSDFIPAMKYVHASPLEKTLGKMFKDVALSGPIILNLGLSIPLNNPDETKVKGQIAIQDGVMDLAQWNLRINHLNGDVQFTEKTTDAKNIRGELFDKPLQFDLTTKQKTKELSVVQADFKNNLSMKDLENWLSIPFTQVVEGDVDVVGNIEFSLTQPFVVTLKSNLVGASIHLMEPYGKTAQKPRDLTAQLTLEHDKPMRMKLNYADILGAAIVLDRKQEKYQLISANLNFGKDEIAWPAAPGLFISGQFTDLDWVKIKTYMDQSSGKNVALAMPPLKGIDVRTKQLQLGGQTLTNVRVQAEPSNNNWDVSINSNELVGDLNIPMNLNRQSTISAQFQKVIFHSPANKQTRLNFDVKSLPTLSIAIKELRYNDMSLGALTFNATPSASGLNIQKLKINLPQLNLQANGEWVQTGNSMQTHLQGSAVSRRVSDLLNRFGLDARNFEANNGTLDFDLNWPDAPYAPSLANLSGSASLNIGRGRIVDIGAQGGAKMGIGRMLSIFSLQTIPRRLALDFSDVTQGGYSFDSVRGDFSIRSGDLYTKNMRFEGPVAQVGIDGRIGLKNKDYDFVLKVVAHVTSSIPVAATLLTGNPLIGLGALAVNSVVSASIATNYYSVTGSWSNPVWKSISSSRSQQRAATQP